MLKDNHLKTKKKKNKKTRWEQTGWLENDNFFHIYWVTFIELWHESTIIFLQYLSEEALFKYLLIQVYCAPHTGKLSEASWAPSVSQSNPKAASFHGRKLQGAHLCHVPVAQISPLNWVYMKGQYWAEDTSRGISSSLFKGSFDLQEKSNRNLAQLIVKPLIFPLEFHWLSDILTPYFQQ